MSTYRFRSETAQMFRAEGMAVGRAEGEAIGEARGEAISILRVLEGREIPVSESVHARVMSTTDLALLEAWLVRALHATTAEEIFD